MTEVLYRGVFTSDTDYEKGDCVTDDGSTWHCKVPHTRSRPGTSKDWQLMAESGAGRGSFCKCAYCGRRALKFQDGNCVGCGAPLPMPEREPDRIEVTRLGSKEREYIYVGRGGGGA